MVSISQNSFDDLAQLRYLSHVAEEELSSANIHLLGPTEFWCRGRIDARLLHVRDKTEVGTRCVQAFFPK